MKKGTLTLKELDKLIEVASAMEGGKIIGFIGGIPVIEKKEVPKGEIWAIDMDQFKSTNIEWK